MNGMVTRGAAAGLFAVLLVGGFGCVSRGDYDSLQQIKDNQARVIANLKNYNRELQMQYDRAVADGPMSEKELDRLRRERDIFREANEKLQADLAKRFEMSPMPAGVTREKWGIRVKDAVLFSPGQHTLKAGGKDAIQAVASSLRGLKIRVEGHTDSDPVKATKARYPYGNLQLSGARALEVANFLIRECGLDPQNVSFAGMGQHFPVASNDSDDGKAKNRRVDIRALEIVDDGGANE